MSNFCVRYDRRYPFNYLDEIQEIEIHFNRKDDTLPAFLEKYQDKTIIIFLNDDTTEKDIELLNSLYERYHNFKLKFDYRSVLLFSKIKTYNIPYFFANTIYTWDQLTGIMDLLPTDIHIINELCFSIKKIAEIAHSKGINVRCTVNVAQASFVTLSAVKQFFIRPEDIDYYSQYIDTFEIVSNKNNINTIYQIYTHDKKWFGDLKEIIIGLPSSLDNRHIIPFFARYRSNCDKRCQKGHSCSICERITSLANTLEEKSLIFTSKENDIDF